MALESGLEGRQSAPRGPKRAPRRSKERMSCACRRPSGPHGHDMHATCAIRACQELLGNLRGAIMGPIMETSWALFVRFPRPFEGPENGHARDASRDRSWGPLRALGDVSHGHGEGPGGAPERPQKPQEGPQKDRGAHVVCMSSSFWAPWPRHAHDMRDNGLPGAPLESAGAYVGPLVVPSWAFLVLFPRPFEGSTRASRGFQYTPSPPISSQGRGSLESSPPLPVFFFSTAVTPLLARPRSASSVCLCSVSRCGACF